MRGEGEGEGVCVLLGGCRACCLRVLFGSRIDASSAMPFARSVCVVLSHFSTWFLIASFSSLPTNWGGREDGWRVCEGVG